MVKMYHNIEKYRGEHFAGFNIKAKENFDKWAAKYEISKFCDDPNWIRLSPHFDQMRNFCDIGLPPGCEHQEMFRDKNKKRYYVFHPYKDNYFLGKYGNESIIDWGDQRGLYVEILQPEKSWYAPGKTYTVILSIRDVMDHGDFINYVMGNRERNSKTGGGWIVR